MATKLYILMALVAAVAAEYSNNALTQGSYGNQLMAPNAYAMPERKMYSNYAMDGAPMYESSGMYQPYMTPSQRMMPPDEVYSGYYQQPSSPAMMSAGMNERYTSTPTTGLRSQMYGEMNGQSNMAYTPPSYNSGAQMPYNNYGMDMPAMAQGYAGYAHSSMPAGSERPMMPRYQGSDGHMMMMNEGHYSHGMPSSYISFNGNEANYRW